MQAESGVELVEPLFTVNELVLLVSALELLRFEMQADLRRGRIKPRDLALHRASMADVGRLLDRLAAAGVTLAGGAVMGRAN